MVGKIPNRVLDRQRLRNLVNKPPTSAEGIGHETAVKAHWAKYICVLISGFMEQAIKEIFLEHTFSKASPRVYDYIAGTWPKSINMECDAIGKVLGHFDNEWEAGFTKWLSESERKKEINEIVSWRNSIAHGMEKSTSNVTLQSVTNKFQIACSLVDFIDDLLNNSASTDSI